MSKYKNIPVEIDGHKFDSKLEAKFYGTLKMMQKAGEFSEFTMQEKFPLIVNGVNCGFYKADFTTWLNGLRKTVYDCKGVKTSTYALKKRLVKAIYNIDIKEV